MTSLSRFSTINRVLVSSGRKFFAKKLLFRNPPAFDFRVDEKEVPVVAGTLVTRSCPALIPRSGERHKANKLADDVQSVIDLCAGHDFSGFFECEGEESMDVWRVTVRGRVAREVHLWRDLEN